MANSPKQEMFESMVRTGFEPLKQYIEVKRLEEVISDQDIDMVAEVVAHNLKSWAEWLRHQKANSFGKDN